MFDPNMIDELSKKLSAALPPGLKQFQQESEKSMRSVLQGFFSKMDLVTREEFEVQKGVLSRTRSKLEQLEAQMAELQAQLNPSQPEEKE
ncbi:ubiquinone biosynthesis accessory factor UbiK [Pelagibaculum spongiae]|uniref:Ubiquinone biosynthesis accessory factor UbiK n=1 Tax=Pelagibaculum spongiae TaxID=2080658 RepID=A0A2V1H1M2_9GAMM|nr:accessory factor UbiK family protein [Pelagibaculum spongiae]PVZ70281.1 hypothetical protein DC094_06695 [Pelagibaculum spongiae]